MPDCVNAGGGPCETCPHKFKVARPTRVMLKVFCASLQKLNRKANEGQPGFDTERPN